VNGEAVPREDCFPNTKIPHLREVFPVKKPPTTAQDLEELTMKIFVADDSAMVGERMIRLLSELSRIEVVGQVHDALAAFDAICEATK